MNAFLFFMHLLFSFRLATSHQQRNSKADLHFRKKVFCMSHCLSSLLCSNWIHTVSVRIPLDYAVVSISLHSLLDWATGMMPERLRQVNAACCRSVASKATGHDRKAHSALI